MNIGADVVLKSYSNNSRQQMARAQHLDGKAKGSDALVQQLAPLLFQGERVSQALALLSPAERALLDHLVLLGGDGPTALLRRQLEQDGLIDAPEQPADPWRRTAQDPKGSPWAENSRNFSDLVARLGVHGLVFSSNPNLRGNAMDLSQPGYRLYIPDGVLARLPPVELPAPIVAAPALVQPAAPAALLRDMFTLLSAAAERPLPLTKAGQLPKRTLVQLSSALSVHEDAELVRTQDELSYLPFLRALAEELRLLTVRQGELHLGEPAQALLAAARGQRRQRLYEAYRATDDWSEILQIPGLYLRPTANRLPAPEEFSAARQRVLAAIGALPSERWLSLDQFVDGMRRTHYEFLLRREYGQHDYYSSYGYLGTPNPYSGNNTGWAFDGVYQEADGWAKVEEPFIRAVVTSPLAWLGIVDLGSDGARTGAFRVTADGARLLRGEAPAESEVAAPNVVVQPNFQLFAFEPTDEGVLFRLNQVAERVRTEQASEYRLTRESIYRAQRAGWDVAAILGFLDEISNVPLPQNVRRSIEDWGAEQERVSLRRGVALLQTVDAATLDALAADATLAPLLGRRVTPTATIVGVANLQALHARLLERGHMPALSEGPNEPPSPALTIGANGTVTFRDPVPSIYVLHAISPFSEGTPPEAVRVTRASLRRAAKAGQTPDRILEALDSYTSAPIPAAVRELVQRWARDWGRGAIVNVTVLQFDQEASLAELWDDPEVAPYLRAIPGAPTLAIVRDEGVNAVREALAARGIEPEERLLG